MVPKAATATGRAAIGFNSAGLLWMGVRCNACKTDVALAAIDSKRPHRVAARPAQPMPDIEAVGPSMAGGWPV
ncbi:hypothetical protein BJD10_12785 [Xanthomonas hortorum pv. gardneri]|nr:hypothetical protein BJD10_12785 [Xanthomonas hortorum pv. gardneri]